MLGTVTAPCRVEKTGPKSFRMILTQGLNRQIRRMCEYFDYRVQELKRVRILNITLGNLKEGEYRHIEGKEYHKLLALIADSMNTPVIHK